MACLKFVLIVTLCIVPNVAESSCKDECLCQDDQCAACNATGYNGSVCERSCSVGCLDGLCDAHTGVCYRNECKENFKGKDCSKCTVGKFGEYCLQDCPPHCASCSSNVSCTSCVQGYVGKICDIMCPEGCKADLCSKDRKCYQCKPNFVGEFCDNCTNGTLCNEDCLPNCLSCLSYNNCTECKLGYHGETCQLNCSHGCYANKCNQKNGACYYGCKPDFRGDFCQECVKGRYGKNCSGSCSSTCKEKVCKQTTGHCLNGCNFAMYGPTCEYNCPQNCKTCSSNISCHTCNVGFWGEFCTLKCSESCLESCFQNGTCQNCKDGYYGSFCNLPCPALCTDVRCTTEFARNQCKHNCSLYCCNDTCNRNGSCEACLSDFDSEKAESSCKDECLCQDDQCAACYATDYNGSVCERNCSVGCLDGLCDAHTGICYRNECKQNFRGKDCSKCTVGKFGEYCLEDCPPHCASCSSNVSCTSCVQGYVGKICDIMCPEGCKADLCSKDRKCYQCKPNFVGEFCDNCTNGTLCNEDCLPNCLSCLSYNNCTECKLGYHGETCQLTCSHGCLANKCNQKKGTCDYGCKPEFRGDFCQECVKARYGQTCSGSCPSTCKGNVCNKTTGHCLDGCSFAMYGPTCEYNCLLNCETCSSNISCHTCSSGFWGDLCSRKCSESCFGSCFQNGTCQNCKAGYYGSFCNLACPAQCTDLLCTADKACDSGFCSKRQSYDIEKIVWISIACLLAVITVVLLAQNILLKRRFTQKHSTISNIHTGTDNLDINTADLEMATFLPLSEGTISSYQNQQSAVYVLPRNTTASNMQNGEDVCGDISAHVYSGPYEQPIEFREQNIYTGQQTNDTQTVGPYVNIAAAASGDTDRDGRRYEEPRPERYEQLTPRRWTGNYCDLQEL